MSAKYIFRLDDICENMNWDNYFRIKNIFLQNKVKSLIGVIPNNQDKELLEYPRCGFEFWDEVKNLQRVEGWSIALHGYSHVYETKESGVLRINKRSEFAGLPKDRQNRKIASGIKVFRDKRIKVDAFMAPAHSFDRITIECLKENGINVVTDGYSLFPYYEDDVLFIPQLFSKPRKMLFGIYTWCLHTNSMSDKCIEDVEKFILNNRDDIISFEDAKKYIISDTKHKIQRLFLKSFLIIIRNIRREIARWLDYFKKL